MAPIFPTNEEYTPLTRDGYVFENPPYNENPGGIDIVGTPIYPAIYFATDDTHTFFRFRLRESPLLGTGFKNFAWVVLIDTDMDLADSYEWELALRGNSNDIVLIENLVKNSPGPGFNDHAEGVPIAFPIISYDIARAIVADSMIGDEQNYFLDIAIETNVLKSLLGIDDSSLIRFNYFTAANENNFNKDKMCDNDNYDYCYSDFVSLSTLFAGSILDKESGKALCNAKVALTINNIVKYETYTDSYGKFKFDDFEPGVYTVQITKCCYLPLCLCNQVILKKNYINVYNYSLAPDCICETKCKIIEAENELVGEKERVYKKITDYLATVTFTTQTVWQYLQLLCLVNDGTSELDCCVSKVLNTVSICKECDNNG